MTRSPFFYVGDKYKLMPQLIKLMPENINTLYEPFLGGGSSFMNIPAQSYVLNDINHEMIELHQYFNNNSNNKNKFFRELVNCARKYELSISCEGDKVPDELKVKYKKTYYAHINKEGYLKLREDYNNTKDIKLLYLLLIYGFNHMIRFNKQGKFNLPVGNVDFNKNTKNAIYDYLTCCENRKIKYKCCDYREFIKKMHFNKNDFLYLDPPYLISNSEYNKVWDEKKERDLYELLDELDKEGIKFGLSNLLIHKDQENKILRKWSKKYHVHTIKSNYISFNDNTKKKSKEIYITNYEKK